MVGRRRRLIITGAIALAASAALVRAIAHPPAAALAQTAPAQALPTMPAGPSTTTTSRARVEPTDPKQLRTLLPERVGPLKRIDAEAGIRTLGEMRSSVAQATFGLEGQPDAGHASIKIVDYIGMPGLVESAAPWRSLDIDNATDAEYSRTVTVAGNKALETYAKQPRSGSINVLVAGRFVVTIEVTGLPPETLRATAEAMKLDQLAAK